MRCYESLTFPVAMMMMPHAGVRAVISCVVVVFGHGIERWTGRSGEGGGRREREGGEEGTRLGHVMGTYT